MTVRRPSSSDVKTVAAELGMTLSDSAAQTYHDLMQGLLDAYDAVEDMEAALPATAYPREDASRPSADDNPFGAWAARGTIKGKSGGPLEGKTVAIKDNTCVAGWPMQNGSTVLEGYVPEMDATIVTRLLDAGAEIAGTATCEYYCASGGSHTSALGVVENPVVPGHNAGGSSSGSAVLVAAEIVDMATGGDQGGSIRIPASYCGIVGLKPTHGLVPYTGIFAVDLTIDHTGPMTRTVADNALMLEVMAGPDGLDPRQQGAPGLRYTEALGQGVEGLRVGVVTEGFGHPGAEDDVENRVREAAQKLGEAGAKVDEVSIPLHAAGGAIWTPIFLEGATELMMRQNAYGTNMKSMFLESLLDAQAKWRDHADEFSPTLKLGLLTGHYMSSRNRGRFYGKAQNLNRLLTKAYDDALANYDVLLMPTTPMAASKLPPQDAPDEEIVARAFEMVPNTSPFCATGHPSLSVPVGKTSDGRPVGAMLSGRYHDETTLYRAAEVLETAYSA